MIRCEYRGGCDHGATHVLAVSHVRSAASVFHYYCESHARKEEASTDENRYFTVVDAFPLDRS